MSLIKYVNMYIVQPACYTTPMYTLYTALHSMHTCHTPVGKPPCREHVGRQRRGHQGAAGGRAGGHTGDGRGTPMLDLMLVYR